MQQSLHVLVVDRDGCAALAETYGPKWILPIVSCPERTRAIPGILSWVERHGLRCRAIGQWLGRVSATADAIDWLLVVRAGAGPTPSPSLRPLRWIPLALLRSSASLFDYQQWAIGKANAGAGPPNVPGPFGALTWPDRVTEWIEDVAGAPLDQTTTYRAGPYEIVMGLSTRWSPKYFKGLSSDRASEARLTSTLSAAFPTMFARTSALTTQSDGSVWWLTEGCAGFPLADRLTIEHAERVGAACAWIQQHGTSLGGVASDLPALDLSSAAAWSMELLRSSGSDDRGEFRPALERAFDYVSSSSAPHSWVPMDLDPANVLVDNSGGLRFIDLDDSYMGPAPLAIATLARRVKRLEGQKRNAAPWIDALYWSYEQRWSLSPFDVCAREAFNLVSSAVELHIGWRRVVAKIERGELHGALDAITKRVALQLAHVVTPVSAGPAVHSNR